MNNKVFFVNKSEIEGRLDPYFYLPEFRQKIELFKQLNFQQLGNFIENWDRGDGPRDGFYTDDTSQIYFLRVQNLKENTIDLSDVKFIYRHIHETKLKRSQVKAGDVVFAISGTKNNLGTVSIIPNHIKEANLNSALVRLELNNKLNKEFFCLLFGLEFVRSQIDFIGKGAAQNNLNNQEISSIYIPDFSLEKQNDIVNLYNQKWRKYKEKLNQSQTLLNSISDYLLEQLGIFVPSVDNSLNNRLFMTSFSELDERLDPNYYQDNYNQAIVAIKSGKYKTIPLNQLTDSVFQGVGRNLVDFSNYKLLKVKNIQKNNKIDIDNFEYISEFSQSKILESGDIITPCIGEAVRQIKFSTFNYDENDKNMYLVDNNTGVIRPNSLIIPDFLTYCLCSFIGKMQISRLIGGGGVPFLGAENLKKFIIPVPDLPTQKSIVQHINQIRQQAQALEQEAIDLLKQTQDEIEMMILQ